MTVVTIFDGKLYAFKYPRQRNNELRRLMLQWTDPIWVYNFLKEHERDIPEGKTLLEVADIIADNAGELNNKINLLLNNERRSLDEFFQPLHNQEYGEGMFILQKGREQYLRLYALKIEDNCYIITGGAVKLTRTMQERDHTQEELRKLRRCRDHLKGHDVFDRDSFCEWLNEKDNENQ